MRETKFRAWNPIDKKLEYWSLNDLCYHSPDRPDICLQNWQEYTGLKDKNGKEIYEGDVLRYQDDCGRWQVGDVRDRDYSEFYIHAKGGDEEGNCDGEFHPDYQDVYEIIGNIYENPELLEETQP